MNTKAIIFDFNRTLYDPESGALYEGVLEMLGELQDTRRLFLLSKQEGGRHELLGELGLSECFETVYFVSEKTPEMFEKILSAHQLTPDRCIAVGDRAQGELVAADSVGMETIWLRQGIFADELPSGYTPTHAVNSISELRTLLQKIA